MEPIEPRKLFVGGISRETNEDTLREYFNQYGTVEETLIIRHRLTGRGRGFGFVVFSAISMAEKALRHKTHVILDKKVEVKKAIPKGDWQQGSNGCSSNDCNGVAEINTKKIFVGGLPHDLKEEEFKSYFESFGTVTDAPVMSDKVTGRRRGFGFITFDSEDAVKNVLQNRYHNLKNQTVEVERAHPKDRNYEYMNHDCNNTILGLGGGFPCGYNNIYYCYPASQTPQCYCGWNSFGFGGWGSPSNLIGSLPSHGLWASGNPAIQNSNIFYPSYGVCMNGYCNGSCHQMAVSTASGNSNGDYDSGVVEVLETRKSPQAHDLSSMKISDVEHQEGEMDDSLSSKNNAAEYQIAEIHDSTVQTPMPQSTKSEQNGQSSHDS